jgi:DNA-binding protein H-NS
MATLKELLAQKETLEREIEQTKKQERSAAIAKVRELMGEYGLTMADLSGKTPPKPAGKKGRTVAAKYRNAATGDTWSGRGLKPNWLKAALVAGRKLEDFAV